MRDRLRSIGAVIAGAIAGIALSLGTDALFRAAGLFPAIEEPMSDSRFVLATFYRTAYGILTSYLTAWLAPSRPMLHALVLGSLGLVATTMGAIVTWKSVPPLGPHWYPLALVVLALPSAWLGGRLRLVQLRGRLDG